MATQQRTVVIKAGPTPRRVEVRKCISFTAPIVELKQLTLT